MVHDRSEYVHRTAVVRSILVIAVVTVLILTIRSVLVPTLETLAEIVLILVLSYAVLIAVCSAPVNIIIRPAVISSRISVSPTGSKSLAIAFVNPLSQKIGATIVGVVPASVSIYSIAAVGNGPGRFDSVISARDRSSCSKSDISLVPFSLAFTFGPRKLLLHFFLLFLIVFVMIAVSLSTCFTAHSQNPDETEYGSRYDCF